MARLGIAAPTESWRLADYGLTCGSCRTLWKTPRPRFPQGPWKTLRVFHTLHRSLLFLMIK